MQEEVSTKIVAVAIRGSKLTGEMLNKALQKFIKDLEKAEKTAAQPKTYCGKQTVKQLVSQNAAISLSFPASCLANWLQGKPITTSPLSLYF